MDALLLPYFLDSVFPCWVAKVQKDLQVRPALRVLLVLPEPAEAACPREV